MIPNIFCPESAKIHHRVVSGDQDGQWCGGKVIFCQGPWGEHFGCLCSYQQSMINLDEYFGIT